VLLTDYISPPKYTVRIGNVFQSRNKSQYWHTAVRKPRELPARKSHLPRAAEPKRSSNTHKIICPSISPELKHTQAILGVRFMAFWWRSLIQLLNCSGESLLEGSSKRERRVVYPIISNTAPNNFWDWFSASEEDLQVALHLKVFNLIYTPNLTWCGVCARRDVLPDQTFSKFTFGY